MKPFILLLTLLFLSVSCKVEKKFEKPKWLIGKWERINNQDSTKATFEIWDANFNGVSITIKDKDTIFKEELKLIETEDNKYFQIIGFDKQPTFFEFTNQTSTSFTCENPQIPFPRKITYALKENQLQSIVANDDFSVEFLFEKK